MSTNGNGSGEHKTATEPLELRALSALADALEGLADRADGGFRGLQAGIAEMDRGLRADVAGLAELVRGLAADVRTALTTIPELRRRIGELEKSVVERPADAE